LRACLRCTWQQVCLESWRCRLPIPDAVTFQQKEAIVLEEQLLKGLALYLWVVFVLWATRRDWE
jgi:hypothetical protein